MSVQIDEDADMLSAYSVDHWEHPDPPEELADLPNARMVLDTVCNIRAELRRLNKDVARVNAALATPAGTLWKWADSWTASQLTELATAMSPAAVEGDAEMRLAHLSCAQPTLLSTLVSDMADMKRSLALLTSQQPAAVPSAPQQPAAPTPAPAKATPANASSYAAKAARAPKPGTHVPAVRAKPPAPTTARARHHPQRLVLKVRATAELAVHVRDNPSLLRSNVNAVLERHKTSAGASLRVSSISTTASGNVVVVAADPFTAADLLDHAEDIAHAILPDSDAYVGADCDQAWYQVLVNGVSTRVHDVEGLPSGMEILADLNEFSSHKYDWASQPRWLGSANDLEHKTRGSVILAFKTEADALHAIEHSVCVFGQLCSARRFEDVPRLRTCDNCC
ncbi:hypothetical protein AURDEDRAFT_177648, partial [Auricularia subglabra TFB-10046 SS5]